MGTTTKVIIITSIYLLVLITSQWPSFSLSYPFAEYESRYSQSQYVMGDNRTMVMGDGDIYTYAGIRYVQGEDPTRINFEHPPLVKYLFGLSYLFTGKPNWVIVPLFYLAVLSFWFLASNLIIKPWARWLSLIFFLGHSTIYMSIPQTMLDFPMTAILLLTLVLYISNRQSASLKKMIAFGVSAGLLLISKYPFPLLFTMVILLYISLVISKIKAKTIILSVLTTLIIYFLGYVSYFIHGHSVIDFIRFEWWRWQWYSGKISGPKGMIWQTIFTGHYPAWWQTDNTIIHVPHWNVFWPFNIVVFILSWTNLNIYKHPLFPYQAWLIISLIGYSFGTAAEDRFLIPLIPGFALFGAKFIEKLSSPGKNEIITK